MMPQIRLLLALALSVLVIGGFVSSNALWRIAPLALSVAWALVEIVIERRRKTPPAA